MSRPLLLACELYRKGRPTGIPDPGLVNPYNGSIAFAVHPGRFIVLTLPLSALLNKLRVGQKIALIEGVVALVLGFLLLISSLSFNTLRHSLDEVRDEGVPNAIVAKDMQMQVVQIQQWLTDISATRGQDGLDDGFKEAEKAHALFVADLERIRTSYQQEKNPAGLASIEQISSRMAAWYATGQKMAHAYVNDGPAAGNKIMGEFDKVSTELQQALEPVVTEQMNEARADIDKAVGGARLTQTYTVAGISISLAVLLFGGFLLAHGIVRPLDRLSRTMADLVERRDFSVQVPVAGRDEIASVARSFNILIAALREILRELGRQVQQIDATARELTANSALSAQSSATASDSAAVMAAAMEQMSAGLEHMRDSAQIAIVVVERAAQHSSEGGKTLHEAIEDLERISGEVREVAQQVADLGEQTQQISGIVALIREVADQTNLLALNAAIEAARAGEQGRGFAVVADEVRKLAERTAKATQEIATMIERIKGSVETAGITMKVALGDANAGTNLGSQANVAIEQIRAAVSEATNAFHDIAHGISEQSAAGQSIATSVGQVAHAADDSKIVVGQVADAAQTLEVLSGSIRSQIERFKV